MAKMRGIKPEFWTDEKIVAVSLPARLLFIGMWHYSCDNGHVDQTPIELKMRVFPMDPITVDEMRAMIGELAGQGLVVDRGDYLFIPNFEKHQRIDKRYMATCEHCGPTSRPPSVPVESPRVPHETTRGNAGPRVEGEGEGEGEKKVKGVRGTRRRSATVAPAKLELSEAEKKWAAETCPDVDLDDATEEFLTWAKSVDKRYADWLAAWRNAMKRRQGWHNERAASQPVPDNTPDWMLA